MIEDTQSTDLSTSKRSSPELSSACIPRKKMKLGESKVCKQNNIVTCSIRLKLVIYLFIYNTKTIIL